MGRSSKTTTKKTPEKDNKTVVDEATTVEKKEEATITDDTVTEDEVLMSSADKEETSDNSEAVDVKEETVEITPQKNSDGNTDSTKEEVVTNENKVSTEETIVKKPRRWMKDVYGYNWNGQCFDE